MKAENAGSYYRVTITNEDLSAFASTWPAHNFDLDAEYRFEFSADTGDLVDIAKFVDGNHVALADNEDGPEFVALSDDACEFGARELDHQSVLAIRFNESSLPRI